jgi:DsbC/DsbD-like thiol-disulfide interchange protein/cytochrome c biogenesis protein CcdA
MVMRWLLLIFALLLGGGAQAQPVALNVPAEFVAETDTPAPRQTVTLALIMRPKPGWHGYWINPGDAGVGLQLSWDLPKGVSAGEPRFPVPSTLLISRLMNHVYEKEHAILVDLQLDPSIAEGTPLPIKVRGDWLACTDRICVPEGADLSLTLTTGDGSAAAAQRSLFDRYRSALPAMLDQKARYTIDGKAIEIAIPFPAGAALSQPYVFVKTLDAVRYASPQSARRVGDWLVIRTDAAAVTSDEIEGLLRIGEDSGLMFQAVPGAIPAGGEAVQTLQSRGEGAPVLEEQAATPNLLLLLLGAIAGGLLLNLMPCVFPILGLKALSLAKMGGDEGEARADALAYGAGVILSCIALGGVMLALRAGGEQVGWAFQLQEPAVVLFLLLLMVAITANLAGMFELRGFEVGDVLTRKPGRIGSFWTGVLAAIVATPCTGPFMAAAMGAALLLPTVPALLLFGALGFGLALPFLLIAFVPRLRKMLPKPGPWLGTFRKAMAVPMALTALALLWLLGRLSGNQGLLVGLGMAVLVLVVLSVYRSSHLRYRNAGLLLIAMPLVVFWQAAKWLPDDAETTEGREDDILTTIAFDEAKLAQLRAEQKPVFLYFTADWCVTCKVNEANAIQRDETAKLFKQRGIVVMEGDYTRRDPAITRFLNSQGRSGVPLYLYYPKGGEGKVLPQILTVSSLEAAVTE